MNYFFLFVFGLVVGSFLNVVALRYRPGQKLLNEKVIGGHSQCPICYKKLAWYELVPVLNFFWQRGKCRHCGHKLSLQYPLIEILTGFIFVSIPWYLAKFYQVSHLALLGESVNWYYWLTAAWILIFILFLLLSIIDFRQLIIPNQINLFLAVLGLLIISVKNYYDKFNSLPNSFLGYYGSLFSIGENILVSHLFAALTAMIIFGAIIFLSRGKAMGWGDFKFVGALGLIFGWPDIMMVLFLAFIIGAIAGGILLIQKKKKIKEAVPFGPYLAIGASLTLFFGYQIIDGYFKLFGL